ncbi:hypothetical protein [Cryobacterium zhongshanensis]|uniref:Uncharacterized protein n=1 Tax=Cryobacterium zhongshanensis TaxID=2928153 RepID=A0AA41QUQ7_9MICO|nr:hypothetical protein [Cryobacterium zhongshanensis]MCI4658075.1 hypothetical protein [Cryobacterium zhongshanensis]
MKRSYSTLTVLVAAVLFASGLAAVQPAGSASANESRASVQAKLAAHLAATSGSAIAALTTIGGAFTSALSIGGVVGSC